MGSASGPFPRSPTTFITLWVQRISVKVEIDPSELVEKETDDRGRLTLGSDYANENVKVLILND